MDGSWAGVVEGAQHRTGDTFGRAVEGMAAGGGLDGVRQAMAELGQIRKVQQAAGRYRSDLKAGGPRRERALRRYGW